MIYRVETALRAGMHTLRYAGSSNIRADELFAVGCNKLRDSARGTRIDVDHLQTSLPAPGELSHLAEVLRVPDWASLDDYIARLRASGMP